MNLVRKAIADLHLDPANARLHPERNRAAIQASLKRFGQQKPIVITPAGMVIAGNGTLEAARAIGWTEIDCVVSDLDGIERTAFGIADNRTSELAAWDDTVLTELLDHLKHEGFDLDDAGFTDAELDDMLKAEQEPADIEEDEVPEPPADPVTKPGDLWLLGEHRLLCGDSTKAEDVERLMDGAKAHLILTDPPYGVDYEGITNDDAAGLPKLLAGAFQNADAIMQPGACYYVCHPDVHAYEFVGAIRSVEWKQARPPVVLWIKDRFVLGRGDYHSQSEPILYGWKKGAAHHAVADRSQSNVWEFPRPASADDHPTMKPVGLFARALQNSTNQKAIVYDPFLGSGTTLVAAEQLGRKCYGMEISPAYCDVIVNRWEALTGKKAVLGSVDE
jgi:DNA modification methylase